MKEILSSSGLFQLGVRAALFRSRKKAERPAYDPELSLAENIRLQLEWVTEAPVSLKTQGRDAFIFELCKSSQRIARVAIRDDADAQMVMTKEKDFSDWVRQEFPADLHRFALVEKSYQIALGDSKPRDVHEELKANKGNVTQNLPLLSRFSPDCMAHAWLRILKPVVLAYEKRKIVHGDIKPDNILVDLTCDGDYEFRMCDWGGHFDPANPRPPYEGTAMFQTKETLLTGEPRAADDARALQITFMEIYAGEPLPRIVEMYPDSFEAVSCHGKNVPYFKQIPAKVRKKIPAPFLKVLNTPCENVLELARAVTEAHLHLK